VTKPDPGGHYEEERRKSIGWGQTAIEAIQEALAALRKEE
jgi:hypothetical protein